MDGTTWCVCVCVCVVCARLCDARGRFGRKAYECRTSALDTGNAARHTPSTVSDGRSAVPWRSGGSLSSGSITTSGFLPANDLPKSKGKCL